MDEALKLLNSQLGRVDELCVPSEEKAKDLTVLLKQLYDASSSASSKALGPLPQLHVHGADADTIWEELQSKNRPLKRAIKNKSNKLLTKLVYEAPDSDSDAEGGDSEQEPPAEESGDESGSASTEEDEDDEEEEESVQSADGDSSQGDEDSEHEQMERWLDQFEEDEERHRQRLESREKRGTGHKGAVEGEEEDDFDFVSKTLYGLESDEEDGEGDGIMASDFFGAPARSSGKQGSGSGSGRKGSSSAPRAAARAPGSDDDDYYDDEEDEEGEGLEMGGEDDEDWDEAAEDDYEGSSGDEAAQEQEQAAAAPMSKHQKRQAQIAAAVADLEKEAVGPKSWDMRGEVRGVDRPENSLLEVAVDVERASKPAPIVTQEYTNSLEDMILQRVKQGKYDDVIPREIRDKHADYDKEDFTLSQEKSKQGLGDIYADDFMQKSMQLDGSAGAREQEARDREEVSGLFAKICRQLDALSHFHYAPKPVVAEASVTTSAPSIMMEEVGPTSESFAAVSMQAPEEVMSHKRGRDAAFMSEAELTTDDKKRLRRAAKMVRRKRIREDEVEEKLAAQVNPVLARKYEAKKADKSMKRDRRVVEGSSLQLESDEKVKSFSKSANFFSALQKQSEEEILRKKEGGKRSKQSNSSVVVSNKSSSLKL